MRNALRRDPSIGSLPVAPRWLAPLLAQRPLLDGLSWRLVGLTALLAAFPSLANWVGPDSLLDWGPSLYVMLIAMLAGLCVLFFGIVLSNLRHRALPRPAALALAVVLGSVLATTVAELTWVFADLERLGPDLGSYPGNVLWGARKTALPWVFLAAAWYFAQRIAERTATLREAELARHHLDARLVETRLQVMQAQTEPHFLFNTLAHVKRLYRTDPILGRAMLDRFCDYLRASLPQIRSDGATLDRELHLARAYLGVQKIRMGKRLAVSIDVPEHLRDRPFPSMMLLTVVENAVKHGLSPLPDGGSITISAEAQDGGLRVVVTDSGMGFSSTKGSGVGLSNIRARLSSLYGSAGSLTLSPNAPRGIVAAIAIPA